MAFNAYTSHWSTRLVLSIKTEDGDSETIRPYNSVNINFSRAVSLVDSVDDANVGFIFGNRRYTFSIEVFPVRGTDSARESTKSALYFLNDLFLNGKIFEFDLLPKKVDVSNAGADTNADTTWAYEKIKMVNCIFTTGGIGSYDTTAGLKIIRFDGLALGAEVAGKTYR